MQSLLDLSQPRAYIVRIRARPLWATASETTKPVPGEQACTTATLAKSITFRVGGPDWVRLSKAKDALIETALPRGRPEQADMVAIAHHGAMPEVPAATAALE